MLHTYQMERGLSSDDDLYKECLFPPPSSSSLSLFHCWSLCAAFKWALLEPISITFGIFSMTTEKHTHQVDLKQVLERERAYDKKQSLYTGSSGWNSFIRTMKKVTFGAGLLFIRQDIFCYQAVRVTSTCTTETLGSRFQGCPLAVDQSVHLVLVVQDFVS